MVRFLLEAGADVNVDQNGLTALLHACRHAPAINLEEMVQTLLSHGARVGPCGDAGQTALHSLCRRSTEDFALEPVFNMILDAGGPALVHVRDKGGHTALISAANAGALRLLVAAKADVDDRNAANKCGLELACTYNRSVAVTKFFLNTASGKAAMRLDAVSPSGGPRESLLLGAVRAASINLLQLLLDSGANAAAWDKDGCTLLSLAMQRRGNDEALSHQVAEALIKAGAGRTINKLDRTGRTALSYAMEKCFKLWTIELLVAAGADATLGKANALSASLHVSSEYTRAMLAGDTKLRDVNCRNRAGFPALLTAVSLNDVDAARFLLDAKADVNARLKQDIFCGSRAPSANEYLNRSAGRLVYLPHCHAGDTALMLAARSGHAEAVELLLERGADATLRNSRGSLALKAACEPDKVRPGIIESLLTAMGPRPRGSDLDEALTMAMSAAGLYLTDQWTDSPDTPLYECNAEAIELLLDAGARPGVAFNTLALHLQPEERRGSLPDHFPRVPLTYYFCRLGSPALLRRLLLAGLDPFEDQGGGATLAMRAVPSATLEVLLEHIGTHGGRLAHKMPQRGCLGKMLVSVGRFFGIRV
jgi:ankyrin repeat protein